MKDGDYLGSEEHLMTAFGISRPTLRQAVRLLEHERLLVIKRGSGGGFYVRRPQVEAVAHAAAIYLTIEHATPRDLFAASVPLLTEAVRLASGCTDEHLHAQLGALVCAEDANLSFLDDLTIDLQFARVIGEMCGNPAIKLFISIIYEFGKSQWQSGLMKRHTKYPPELRDARNRLIEAIGAGDPELAMLYSRRRATISFRLIDEMPDTLKVVELGRTP